MNGHEHVHVDGHGACTLPRESLEEILFFQGQTHSPVPDRSYNGFEDSIKGAI
jgi:hypothetical protein